MAATSLKRDQKLEIRNWRAFQEVCAPKSAPMLASIKFPGARIGPAYFAPLSDQS